jgi:multimeric flavodoxin WrbA/putative sterol carrier protein
MRKISKPKQFFLYAGPFPPLIFFQVWATPDRTPESLLISALSMLAYCALLLVIASRWDRPGYFDWAIAGYFTVICGFLLLWPDGAAGLLAHYAATGIYVCLFGAAFFPPLLGMDPFTYHYAKKSAPPESWSHPIFIKINLIMTFVWAGIFAVGMALSLYPSIIMKTIIPNGLIVFFGFPFNSRFPNFYLKRLGLPSLTEQRGMARERADRTPAGPSPVPLPTSAREAISRMPDAFNPKAAGQISAVIEFAVFGSETFEAYVNIHDGNCILDDQPQSKPDLIIRTPADVWLGICRGELDGQELFMQKAYTAEGNLSLLVNMKKIFSRAPSAKIVQTTSKIEQPLGIRQTTTDPEQQVTSRKENAMKVLALNSSPRGEDQSKTELMLHHLVQGMREAGAEVEIVHLRKKVVKNCIGCFTCWTKTPGVCIHKDDMTNELFPKFLKSDLVVYATPLYHFTMNATMKAFIERTLPIVQPFFERENEKTRHPLRHEFPKAVFLSVAGFPEMSVFDQLSSWVRFIFGRRGTLVAEIYRPAAESLALPFFKAKAQDILDATKQAGREIVESLKVSQETFARVTQDLTEDKEIFGKMGNLFWKSCIAEGVTPKEFAEKGLIPRPDSLETFMMVMPMGFNPDSAGETKAVLQFNFSGEAEGSCHFSIENRQIKAIRGPAEKPDLTIDSPFEVWMDIMTRKADGQQMFMAQKYKVTGDLSLLIRMNQLFGK